MFPYHSLVALCFFSLSAGAIFHRRGSVHESAPYSNVTLITTASFPAPSKSTATYSRPLSEASQSLQSVKDSTSGPSGEYETPQPTDSGSTRVPASDNITNPATSAFEASSNTTSTSSGQPLTGPSIPTSGIYTNATLTESRRFSNATCTVHIPSASVDYWYPPTYSHVIGTMTTAALNFTNADSYTLIPQTTTFDVASALESDFVCTSSESYISEWDWTLTVCLDYTDKPTAAATSIAYRTAAAPFPPGGVIPVGDALLYDLYTDPQPSATALISIAPNVTLTETSATPFVYITEYEVESGNRTETVQLRSAQVYPYWVKGVDYEPTATGSLPDGFLESIPQSACDAGQLQATVTVLIVVDLYYQNRPNANPFLVHFESSVIGFNDPTDPVVVINNAGTSIGQPLTMDDWDLPGVPDKPTSVSIQPNIAVPTTEAGNNINIINAGSHEPQVPDMPPSTQVTVGTIGTNVIVVGPSSEVVIGSQTLRPGGSPITLGNGVPVSLAPSATAIVVGGTTSQLPQISNLPAQPPIQPAPVLTIGSSTLTPNAATQFFIAPGQTLTPGGVATVDGTLVSLAPSASFVVIGGSTQILPTGGAEVLPASASPPQIVVGSSTITAQPTAGGLGGPNNPGSGPTFIVSGQTLAPGGSAITVSGTTISLAPSGSFVVINGVTTNVANFAAPAATPTLTIGNGKFTPVPGTGTTFIISDQTLAPGGPAITVSGTTISLAPSASFVVVNGVTSTLINSAAAQITSPPSLTIGNGIFKPLPGTSTAYLIGSVLLTPGGSIVVADTTISLALGATALIINGQTSLITTQTRPSITNAPLLTIGSSTYTAISGTTFVIGGQTLTPGGTITVDGTTISLAPGATQLVYGSSGHSTTTVLFPATTTRTKSLTGTLDANPSARRSGSNGQAAATSPRSDSGSRSGTYGGIISSFFLLLGYLFA